MMNRKAFSFLVFCVMLIMVFTWVNSSQALQNQSPNVPEIDLGQPGLSFRYVKTFGTTEQPYLVDTAHINRPWGLFMDASDQLYVTEERGYRLLRYNSSWVQTLSIGKAGVCYTDEYVMCAPQDAVTDSSANIWVADGNRIVQYDSSGEFLQQFPEEDPWEEGSGNDRFYETRGIALDSANHLFVSDSNNHRIQVFDISSGSPVYSDTIGTTGVSGSADGSFNQPHRIAIDSNDDLYVTDSENDRVQKCVYSGGWTCSTIDSGLGYPQGIAADGTDIYIADTENYKIRKCAGGGSCSDFANTYVGIYDVAVDSSGNVYASDAYEAVVVKFDSAGVHQGEPLGVEGEPYLTDGYHYNVPRVAVDSADNLIIIEEHGHRLVKLDRYGNHVWSYGVPGVDAWDNDHFNYPHGVATDASNNIYVANGDVVQIFDSSGVYQDTLDDEFSWIAGIAVNDAGNIYLSDARKHIVKIYDSNLTNIGQIGVTNQCGSTNDRFCWPIGLEVDAAGNIYVADAGNARVQKFNSSLQWQMTIGLVGDWGESFAEFDSPEDIAIDSQGRIYVADIWNNRVQVFDASGAYLTTIGGDWGNSSSQFRSVSGVAVDSADNVYVSDFWNARIQKYAPGIPDWEQVNLNGFGDRWNTGVASLEIFNNQLYAASASWDGQGAQIWQSSDGSSWTAVSEPGFGSVYTNTNPAIPDMIAFDGQLYASTGWDDIAGQVWRSPDGATWTQVIDDGFGNANNNVVARFSEFNNSLYAATGNSDDGAEIWRSATGDAGSWSSVVLGGNGDVDNTYITCFAIFGGDLYAGVENNDTGARVWRTSNGTTWTQVSANGFGNADNVHLASITVFEGMLYASTRNNETGAEIWRSANGTTWTQFASGGIDNPDNDKIESLYVFDGVLYAASSTRNNTGLRVWRLNENDTFEQISPHGFGDNNNNSTLWNSATIDYLDKLFIGTWNGANGGELWRYDPEYRIYLPAILNNYTPPGASVWSEFSSPTTEILYSVDMVSATDGWAVGRGGVILRFNGIEWVQSPSPVMANFRSVSMSSSNNGWIVGQDTTTYDEVVLRWDGSTWNTVSLPVDFFGASDVSAPDSTTAWFSLGYALCTPICEGDQGGIINWWDGSSWDQLSTTPQHIGPDSISMVDANDGWVVGAKYIPTTQNIDSSILHWNGATWTETNHPNVSGLNAVDTSDTANAWAVGGGGNILHWNGVDWSVVPTSGYPNLNAVDIVSDIDVWAVGRSTIQHWNGTAWEEVTNPVTEVLNSVSMVSDNEGWAVGENGTILYYGPELP